LLTVPLLASIVAYVVGTPILPAVNLGLAVLWAMAGPSLLLLRRTLIVGTDGIVIRQLFRRQRFVPHRRIVNVDVRGRQLTLILTDGPSLRFVVKHSEFVPHNLLQEALIQHVRQAHVHFLSNAEARVEPPANLVRGGRSLDAWLAAIAEAREAHADFRSPAI